MTAELSRRTLVNGVELAWDAWGPDDGPTLVLLHGFSGGSRDFDLHLEALLDTGHRVAFFEQRGHGNSGHGAPEAYTLDQLAADAITLLPTISEKPVALLGHSLGGKIAMRVAIQAPELLSSLILMDTSGWSLHDLDEERAAFLEAFIDAYDPADGLPTGLPAGPEDQLVAEAVAPDLIARRRESNGRMDPHALKQLGLELFARSQDLRGALAAIKVPVTVIVGSLDEPYASQAGELSDVTGGQLIVIDGAYHSPQLTHAEEWLKAIQDHLDRSASATS